MLYGQKEILDFPCGLVDKNPPANVGDMDSVPGLGRFLMLEGNQAHEPQALEPALQQEKPCNENPKCHNEE